MIKNGLKNTLQILIILIFNNFLAQNKLENAPKNSDKVTAVSKTDTVKIEKEQIDDIVRSKADNIRNEVPKKMSYLNQNAEVSYQDMKINADYIQIDWDKGLIFARGKVDSIGKITEPAVKVESLDMLVEGAKDFQILGKETIPLGFGITLKADGQKQFLYYINKGGKQYKCEPGPYYKESDCDKVIEVIKTIK